MRFDKPAATARDPRPWRSRSFLCRVSGPFVLTELR